MSLLSGAVHFFPAFKNISCFHSVTRPAVFPKHGTPLRLSSQMSEKIASLEKELLEKKPWQLQGEVTAQKRPENSLLEETLHFDHAVRMGRAPPDPGGAGGARVWTLPAWFLPTSSHASCCLQRR